MPLVDTSRSSLLLPTDFERSKRMRRVRLVVAALFASLLFLEMCLRIAPELVSEPMRSLILETTARRVFDERRYGMGKEDATILLPHVANTDFLIVGDAFPYGYMAPPEATLDALLEVTLKRSAVNLALPVRDVRDFSRMIEVGLRYHPKNVLYGISAEDFVYHGESESDPLSPSRTFASLPSDRGLFRQNLAAKDEVIHWARLLKAPFYTLDLWNVLEAEDKLVREKRVGVFVQGHYFSMRRKEVWDPKIDWENPSVRLEAALNLKRIEEANHLVQAAGGRLFVVLFPSREMVYGPLMERGDLVYRESHYETFRQFTSDLTRRQIPVMDLTPEFRFAAEEGKKLYHSIDGHFDISGNREAALILARYFRANE